MEGTAGGGGGQRTREHPMMHCQERKGEQKRLQECDVQAVPPERLGSVIVGGGLDEGTPEKLKRVEQVSVAPLPGLRDLLARVSKCRLEVRAHVAKLLQLLDGAGHVSAHGVESTSLQVQLQRVSHAAPLAAQGCVLA